MDSNTTTELLPGQSAPLAIITSTDQSGIVLIATALALCFALVSLLIRIFIRLEFRQKFAPDDFTAGIAIMFAIIQSSLVFVQVSKGFGKTVDDISPSGLVDIQKTLYASDIFYLITLWSTKCSVAFLFLRLSPDKRHNLASNVILVGATVAMVVSVFLVALRCDLASPWIFINAQCSNLVRYLPVIFARILTSISFVRWQVISAFDIVTEVVLFSTSAYMVHGLQLSLEKKIVVISAFGLRLPIIASIVMRLYYLNLELASPDPTLTGVLTSVCTQIELSYAIIAATTPCLRPFMTALSTNYGAPAEPKTTPTPNGTGGSGQHTYNLNSLSRGSRPGRTEDKKPQMATPTTRWDQAQHRVAVVAGDQHSMESHESKQMIISKNTEWAVEYQGHYREQQASKHKGDGSS